jgi:hypothetical protein
MRKARGDRRIDGMREIRRACGDCGDTSMMETSYPMDQEVVFPSFPSSTWERVGRLSPRSGFDPFRVAVSRGRSRGFHPRLFTSIPSGDNPPESPVGPTHGYSHQSPPGMIGPSPRVSSSG